MDELDKIENHIKTGKPEWFIRNCFCCIQPDFTEICREGRVSIAKWMIEHGADVHAVDNCALRWASDYGHSEIVKLLLAAGSDVHANNDYALRLASSNGRTEIVKLLLAAGADVHANNNEALCWAIHNGHSEIVKLLEEAISL